MSHDFGNYCLVLKYFKTSYSLNLLVSQGVIDGAENNGDIYNSVSHICDFMSCGCLSFCPSGSVPAQISNRT